MNAPTPRMLTPARAVAPALIAGLVCGLAYLRFGTGSEPVAVPPGAEAGDLVLERCEYSTEDGTYDADCATVVVPENRADPGSRLIALREQSRLHPGWAATGGRSTIGRNAPGRRIKPG